MSELRSNRFDMGRFQDETVSLWDKFLLAISLFGAYLYMGGYLLVPKAYVAGPALLLLATIFCFRWKLLFTNLTRESRLFSLTLVGYFCIIVATLAINGEDVSEFDLVSRFLIAAPVLLFVLRYPPSLTGFFLVTAVGAALVGIHSSYNYFVLDAVRVSAFDNAIHYGNGALILAFISLSALPWALSQRNRLILSVLLISGFVGGGIASIFSGSRSGWVAVPIFLVIIAYAFWPHLKQRRSLQVIAALGFLVPLILAFQTDMVETRVALADKEIENYFQKGENDSSVGLRLDMWKSGLTGFTDSPIFGLGPTEYERIQSQQIESGYIHEKVSDYRHLHNQYIDLLTKSGAVGFLAYLVLLAVPFLLFFRRLRSSDVAVQSLAVAGCLFIAGHSVFNLTQSLLERNIGVLMFVFVPVFIWSLIVNSERKMEASE